MSKASDNARFDEIENLVTSEEYKDKLKAAETTSQLREVGAEAGVDVDDTTANRRTVLPGPLAARHWTIEPDLSNAAAFAAAAVHEPVVAGELDDVDGAVDPPGQVDAEEGQPRVRDRVDESAHEIGPLGRQ